MKILEVSDFRETGGSAIAAKRIASALEKINVHCVRISSDSSIPEESLFLGKKVSLLRDLMGLAGLSGWTRKMVRKETLRQFRILLNRHNPDHVLFHNIHGAHWPIEMVLEALEYTHTSWTLHDCWSFLGTYYPSHSPNPDRQILPEIDYFWSKLKKSSHSISGITPSAWMNDQASQSRWQENMVKTIHNPVPDSFFIESNKDASKHVLGLSLDKPIVLCVAGNLDEARKGGHILREILSSSIIDQAEFLLVGNGESYAESGSSKIKNLGFVHDEITLKLAYHAADLFLHPAPIDNLPNTVAESMSCGTPVIAFETGGLPEMIIDGKNGWLVKELSATSMIKHLNALLKSKDLNLKSYGSEAKDMAKVLFSESHAAKSYDSHFNRMKEQLKA